MLCFLPVALDDVSVMVRNLKRQFVAPEVAVEVGCEESSKVGVILLAVL